MPELVVIFLVVVGIVVPMFFFLTSTSAKRKESIEFLSFTAQMAGWIIPVMLSALTLKMELRSQTV